MVPACWLPCEEVMSLHLIWLDSGMPGLLPWAGSGQGQTKWFPTLSRSLRCLIFVSPELEEQGRVGAELPAVVEPRLALSPEIQSAWEVSSQGYPRDAVGTGHQASDLGIA